MLTGRLFGFAIGAITLCILIGVPYYLINGGAEKFLIGRLRRRYAGLDIRDAPRTDDVCVMYHTYRGLLIWFVQDEHHACGSPADMRTLLRRLRNWNLSWGLLSCGAVFIPFLALASYRSQLRSIERQLVGGPIAPDTPGHVAAGYGARPSLFHRTFGWIAAVLSAVFAVNVIAMTLEGDFATAGVAVLIALLLGAVARDWICGPQAVDENTPD